MNVISRKENLIRNSDLMVLNSLSLHMCVVFMTLITTKYVGCKSSESHRHFNRTMLGMANKHKVLCKNCYPYMLSLQTRFVINFTSLYTSSGSMCGNNVDRIVKNKIIFNLDPEESSYILWETFSIHNKTHPMRA